MFKLNDLLPVEDHDVVLQLRLVLVSHARGPVALVGTTWWLSSQSPVKFYEPWHWPHAIVWLTAQFGAGNLVRVGLQSLVRRRYWWCCTASATIVTVGPGVALSCAHTHVAISSVRPGGCYRRWWCCTTLLINSWFPCVLRVWKYATCIPWGPKANIYSICTCGKYAGNPL